MLFTFYKDLKINDFVNREKKIIFVGDKINFSVLATNDVPWNYRSTIRKFVKSAKTKTLPRPSWAQLLLKNCRVGWLISRLLLPFSTLRLANQVKFLGPLGLTIS